MNARLYTVVLNIKMISKRTLWCYVIIILHTLINGQRTGRPTFPPLPPPTFDEPDYNYVYLNFSVVANPEIRRYTEEFNALCPHTGLCDVHVYINDSLFQYISDELYEVPCCGVCSCPSSNCMETRECCIDALPRLLTTEEVRAIHDEPAKCIYTQYRSYDADKYNGEAYTLITECLESYHDEDVREKCLKSYSEFDFVVDIPGYLPVTDNRTMTSYKNLFCGLCNHVPRSELILWDTKVECNESIVLGESEKVQSLSDIEQFIARDSRCNLVFNEPYYLQYRQPFIQRCNPYIDKCNVTGLWQQYDSELESLCTSYLSSYKGYKNVHCYLCNGFDRSTIEEICLDEAPTWRPSSFVSLLDFNNLELSDKEESPESTMEQDCPEGQKYDVWAKVCRHLVCPEFAILKDNECQPIFDECTYDVTIRLVPMADKMDVRVIPTLQDLLGDDVTRSVSAIKSASVELCDIQTFVKLKEKLLTFEERLQEASFADISYVESVSYVALRVLVTVRDVRDAVLSIEEITNRLYGQAFGIMEGLEIEFAEIDFTLFEQQHTQPSNVVESQRPDPYNRYRFFEAYEDPTDGRAILPVLPILDNYCPQTYRLLPFNLCPLIELDDYEFRVERNSVFLKDQGIYLNMSDVVFSQNGYTITLCSNSFFSNDNDFSRKMSEKNPYAAEFIVSVVCTSISLLCLLIVFVIYCCFTALRTLPGLNNMALVLSLFFSQLFYVFGGGVEIKAVWLCGAIGLLLHYCLVASFLWMGVCTFHMMMVFVFISKRSGSENTRTAFIRYAVIANVATAALVCINIIVSVTTGGPGFGYGGQLCYISHKLMILYTVAIPLGAVIICNFLMFLYVIIKVSRLPDVKKNTKHERRNIVIFAKLSTLTGLTWVFAYIYQWTDVKAFAYLFIVANASQGLFIMFSFIINKRVWAMVNNSFKSSSFYKSRSSKTYETSAGKSSLK